MGRRILALVACLVALPVVAPSIGAAAPVDPAAQRCINTYNEYLRRVFVPAGLSLRACARDALRGREADPAACVTADRRGSIAARQAQVTALFDAGVCAGSEPLQQGAAAGNAAHRQAAVDLARDLFGDPLGPPRGGQADAACLDAGVSQAVLGLSALVRAHRICVSRGMRTGTVSDEPTLSDTCGTRTHLDASGRAPEVLGRVAAATRGACAGRATAGLFPRLDAACHADAGALAACIERAAACRACLALDATNWTPVADGPAHDCDFFDDGLPNLSCGVLEYPPWALCRLGEGSRLLFESIGLPLVLQLSGAVRVQCGAVGADGVAPCRCDADQRLGSAGGQSIVLPAIGDVCFNPHGDCPMGAVDCDGGSPAGVDLAIAHNLGPCQGNADCAAACAARCAALGATYAVADAACEGFCQGGSADGAVCSRDSQCAGGDCAGREPVTHAGVCNCSCQGTSLGPPAGAGALHCGLGIRIDVEQPSNGICGDGPTAYREPPFCVALTTATADALITQANNDPSRTLDQLPPETPMGSAARCDELAQGRTGGLQLVGSLALLDSTLGDAMMTTAIACE